MTLDSGQLTDQPVWKALEEHHRDVGEVHLRDLFAQDPKRGERLTAEAAGVYLDYSKNRVTDKTLQLLLALAEQQGRHRANRGHVPWRQDQPLGAAIRPSRGAPRAAWHADARRR